jgi:hypothetical protein
MAYPSPVFNLTCRIYQAMGTGPFPLAGGIVSSCQLRLNKPGIVAASGGGAGVTGMLLLLPKGTDIRPSHLAVVADAVQVPDGSGEYYVVSWVNDVAKGFPNEYRLALITLLTNKANATVWPMP